MGRALGVDLGLRRVGLALTDSSRVICSPLRAIPFASERRLIEELARLCRNHEADLVVFGLPLSADGSEGEGCERARRIAKKLSGMGIATKLQDESWSSREAEDIIRATGRSRRTAVGKVDAVAASLILRDFLEGAASAR